jgi:nucleolar complex protein 3
MSKPLQSRHGRVETPTLTDSETIDDSNSANEGDISSTDLGSLVTGTVFSDSDEEKDFEKRPRNVRTNENGEEKNKKLVARLPIKLPDGSVKRMGQRTIRRDSETPSLDSETPPPPRPELIIDDVATGARFGRKAVVDIVSIEPREARIQAAKQQLASICQDIIADPENNVCNCAIDCWLLLSHRD